MVEAITRESVASQVQRHLRNRILLGDYPEGTRLIETELAAELQVSRTPVREALVSLQGKDLVRSLKTGGYVVCDLRAELVDILELRTALETYAVRKAVPRITDEEIDAIEALCDQMEAVSPKRAEQRAELNRKFHEALVSAAGNRRLVKLVGEYQDYFAVAQPLFDPEFSRRTQQEHRDIVAAIRRRDARAASELVETHINHARDQITGSEDQASESS